MTNPDKKQQNLIKRLMCWEVDKETFEKKYQELEHEKNKRFLHSNKIKYDTMFQLSWWY